MPSSPGPTAGAVVDAEMPSYKGFVSAEVAWALAECIKVLDGVGRARRLTLRILYATPWNPWTLVETLDGKNGRRFKKP